MCTRQELNMLIRELLYHVDQVAILSAKIQFKKENQTIQSVEYLSCCDKSNFNMRNENANARFKKVLHFHTAYMRYFVFALDPFAEITIPLSSSSLALFITNIVSRKYPTAVHHTSRTIIEFLQVMDANMVERMYIDYRKQLTEIMREMNLPYDIDVLCKIRHECFRKNIEKQRRRAEKAQDEKLRSQRAQQQTTFYNVPQEIQFESIEHTIIDEQHVYQMPMETMRPPRILQQPEIQNSFIPIVPATSIIAPNESFVHIQNGSVEENTMYVITSYDPITLAVSPDDNNLVIDTSPVTAVPSNDLNCVVDSDDDSQNC